MGNTRNYFATLFVPYDIFIWFSGMISDTLLQEQYLSEGSTLGSWDNSMKSVLCFGEDYSNYNRRKSELPSLENITISVCGLEVRQLIINMGMLNALNACLEN